MKTILGIKGFSLAEYAISANAILGIRDSGKTYTATKAAEELFDADVPFIALDPIGVWHSLRIPGEGKSYSVIVAGGRHADIPLTVKSAGTIVRAAMETGVSLVIDLFSMELSKADWRRIVRETVEILLHENADHGVRHVFIEEAAEFVPQRVQDGQVFAAVEKLVRMGGNSKLGCTLVNQRSADLNKSVLELCANVFVHRQTGKNTVLDLKKWLEVMALDKAEQARIADSLPDLKSGECWAFINDLKKPVRLKIPAKNSQHPDRRAAHNPDGPKRLPLPKMLELFRAKLAPPPKASTPSAPAAGALRHSADLPSPKPKDDAKAAAEHYALGKAYGMEQGWGMGYSAGFDAGFRHAENLFRSAAIEGIRSLQMLPPIPTVPKVPKTPKDSQAPASARPDALKPVASLGPRDALAKAERAVLGVLANFPDGNVSKSKVAILAGYSANGGGFNNALSKLRGYGFISQGDPISLTQDGWIAAGDPKPLPKGASLLDYWCRHNALGRAERAALTALVAALPGSLTKEEVAREAGYEPNGGGFNNALSCLRTLELISGKGELRAAEEFGQ